jgi:hypothetical protein
MPTILSLSPSPPPLSLPPVPPPIRHGHGQGQPPTATTTTILIAIILHLDRLLLSQVPQQVLIQDLQADTSGWPHLTHRPSLPRRSPRVLEFVHLRLHAPTPQDALTDPCVHVAAQVWVP